ncbi:hypothetical protein I6A84_33820 [Frankia sp. CNm7]|uniref:Uncharacterized protein n=1 Tax=Frankia nepalensis TaxID=1836974 RepID=A0A937RJS0_9ACTN|nr:hypothetical protein [Frankia nepalensis]MBL7498314.1 hypothetical protein [Frankia nepalensis]MBL7512983.1 hypothetical protein [Frankia nepalensis]MBL7522933.1 hypothetical protein [Frankia nepalensis]MBL7630139.1 hypothetical protein [Frankia nepalensis]
MDTSEFAIAIASAAVAFVSVVIAAIYAHSQRRIAVRAAVAAERSADEARRSADEARRSADAAEEVTRIERERRAEELADADRAHTVTRMILAWGAGCGPESGLLGHRQAGVTNYA